VFRVLPSLPVPASGERLHGSLARGLEAMRRIVPFMELSLNLGDDD
jgi:hypothetical protein